MPSDQAAVPAHRKEGFGDLAGQVWELTLTYAKEQTVEPIKALGRFVAYGLAGAIWTRDLSTAHTMAAGMNSGVIWVNCFGMFDPAVPFGGVKMSGWGNEQGGQSLDEYLNVKSVWMRVDTVGIT